MPLFLQKSDIYRIVQRELPKGDVYPDSGSPSAFFSTMDSFATASVIGDYYSGAQQQTYNNYFAISSTGNNGRLSDHEITWFGYNLDASVNTVAQRLALVLAQIRKQPAPTLWNILILALTFVPPGVAVGIATYQPGGDAQSWKLDNGLLDNTSVNKSTRLGYSSWDPNTLNYRAFAYEVRIFGYTLTALQYTQLVNALNAQGPARSTFVIRQNLNLATYGYIYQEANVNAYSLVTVAYVDPTSVTTGYTGWVMTDQMEQFQFTDQSGNVFTDQSGDIFVTQS